VQGARAKNNREEKDKETRNALFIFVSFGGYCANLAEPTFEDLFVDMTYDAYATYHVYSGLDDRHGSNSTINCT
jgi:hypothetical protein